EELRAEQAVMQMLSGDLRGALAQAQPIAADGSDRAQVTAAIAEVISLTLIGRADEACERADGALAVHTDLGDQEALSNAGMHLVGKALALEECGRLDEALDLCAAGHLAATEASISSGQAWFLLLAGRGELLHGRPTTA